jgi:hypothetical protein
MWVEEVLEGLCPEQGTPKVKSELGRTLFELFNQITYLRDPRSFADMVGREHLIAVT